MRAPRAAASGRSFTLVVGAVAATAALAACGGSSKSSSSSSAAGSAAAPATGGKALVGLITKTDTNPYFVKMKQGAEAEAAKDGVSLQSFAGKKDGDNDSQVQAIENLISAKAKGILITPSDTKAIVPSIEKARKAGLLVMALDTATDPANAVDLTFATDNYAAGVSIGKWAKAKMGASAANAKIAFLDLSTEQVTVDVQRDQGFMEGFGIDTKDKLKIGDESDPRIVGHSVTGGAEDGGRTAMESLLQKNPDINLVYTINEPSAAGAYAALKAVGKDKSVMIVSIDGGCTGVANVGKGIIGATAQQYPLKMAELGVAAVAKYAKDGTKPSASTGKTYFNTGSTLITNQPQTGLPSQNATWGASHCWG